jgi:hypothetical protein
MGSFIGLTDPPAFFWEMGVPIDLSAHAFISASISDGSVFPTISPASKAA